MEREGSDCPDGAVTVTAFQGGSADFVAGWKAALDAAVKAINEDRDEHQPLRRWEGINQAKAVVEQLVTEMIMDGKAQAK